MKSDERKELYKELLKAWGNDAQLHMCIEEMSELTKEICKYFRAYNEQNTEKLEKVIDALCSEVADVYNMLDQLSYIFGEERVEKYRKEKLIRVKSILDDWKVRNNKK